METGSFCVKLFAILFAHSIQEFENFQLDFYQNGFTLLYFKYYCRHTENYRSN
jgi:hypothetical protein